MQFSWHTHFGLFPGGLFGKSCLLPPTLLFSNQQLGIWYSRWALPYTWNSHQQVWSQVSSLLHEFTYLLYLRKTKYLSIFWLGEHGRDFQGEHNHKHVLQEIGSHLHSHLISDISLTEMLLFWHTVHYFRYSTFFFILCSFTKLPAFLHDLVPFSQPGLSLCLIMYSNLTTPISE